MIPRPWALAIQAIYFIAYFAIGVRLTRSAEKYKVNPKAGIWVSSLHDPKNFSPEGEPLRRRANQFYLAGAIGFVLLLWLL